MKGKRSVRDGILLCIGVALLGMVLPSGAPAVESTVVYETDFDGLAPGNTLPHPGDPGQDGWFQDLAVGDAYGEIQDSIAVTGQALHEHAPATNPCCWQTIDKRDLIPPSLYALPIVKLSGSFYCSTSDLDAANPYMALLSVVGGPHPGYAIVELQLTSGNGMPKGPMGINVGLDYFTGSGIAGIPLTVGQGLAWDTWHSFQLALSQNGDTYLYVEVDGSRQNLTGYKPHRSFYEGQWRRGQLAEALLAQVIAQPWDSPNATDDDVYWDDIRLTAENRFTRSTVMAERGMSPDREADLETDRLALLPSSPNPARGMTTLRFTLPRDARASLHVFDVSGRVVRTLVDGEAGRGLTEAVWDGRDDRGADVPTGAYFIRLEGAGETRVERVLFLR
jgi:hypothetical protein